jgi:hypothetical protein
MKKILFLFGLILSLSAGAQTLVVPGVVTTRSQLVAYNGKDNYVFVNDSTAWYLLDASATVDGVYVISGASGKKWRKVNALPGNYFISSNHFTGAGTFASPFDLDTTKIYYPGYALAGIQRMGSNIKAITLGADLLLSNLHSPGGGLLNNELTMVAVYLPRAATITGAKFIMNTQGVYTAATYNGVALYSVSGSTLTLVASSTDDGTIWKAASGSMITKAFSTPYAAQPGIYYVCAMYNRSAETTAPILSVIDASFQSWLNVLDFTNGLFIHGKHYPGSSLPSTIATSAPGKTAYDPTWAAIY